MVAIRPFRALRYNPELIDDLSRVIAPPYDVIGPEEQAQLYETSPYNIVRLILGKQHPTDTPQDNRYTRAQQDFGVWLSQKVLRPDPAPALYLVEQTFADAGQPRSRLGFIALLELSSSMDRAVYRHEATLAAPKADRTKLLEAVPVNLEPIFCVYPDQGGAVQASLRGLAAAAEPTVQAKFKGDSIRLWAVTEPRTVQDVTRALTSVAVLIADGHHRFEVAYANRDRYGALMAYFVSMEEPSLVVRPIHRVVRHQATTNLETLRDVCLVDRASDLASVTRWLQEGAEQGRFGYSDGRALYQVTVQPDRLARWLMAPSVPLPLATLDVSLLHGLILPSLGYAAGEAGGEGAIRYTADASEALRDAGRGGGQSAWLLREIPLPQVYALAANGLALPPKSTYFYPKVPSGLTLNPLT